MQSNSLIVFVRRIETLEEFIIFLEMSLREPQRNADPIPNYGMCFISFSLLDFVSWLEVLKYVNVEFWVFVTFFVNFLYDNTFWALEVCADNVVWFCWLLWCAFYIADNMYGLCVVVGFHVGRVGRILDMWSLAFYISVIMLHTFCFLLHSFSFFL